MDRLEEKIKLSEKAVNQLKGDAANLDENTATEKTTGLQKPVQSHVVEKQDDDGCKFSKKPSGLSSDVKVSVI